MPDSKYGSPTGSGNPPGKYSKGYLGSMKERGHFVNNGGYRGQMNIGRTDYATNVGNQPKQQSTSELGMRTKALP